jgi:hypothetical protein
MYVRGRARFPDEVSSKARRDRSFKDVRSSADSPARGLRPAYALFFKGKVYRNSENAYQAPKLRAVWRQSPTAPLSLKKRKGNKSYFARRGSRSVDCYVFLFLAVVLSLNLNFR